MAAHTFENVIWGTMSAQEAYRHLVEQALHEDGHDPYNGTISTTHGVVTPRVEPMTLGQAREYADTRLDNMQKWEACEAVPLVAEEPSRWEDMSNVSVNLSVSGAVFNDTVRFHAALAKALKVKPEQIQAWSNVEPGSYDRTTTVERTVTAVAPKEKAVTRYFIITPDSLQIPKWDKGYASQAEARAALGSVLRYRFNGGVPDVDAEIIGITRRESGAPLVSATVSAKKVTGTFHVKLRRLIKRGKVGTERAGWYFYGWAAS